jgi:hypothetical protein
MVRLKYVVGFGDYTDATCEAPQSLESMDTNKYGLGDNVDVFHWSCIEIATAIICACLPALRVLISRLFPGIFGSLETHTVPSTRSGSSRKSHRKGRERIRDIEVPSSKGPQERPGSNDESLVASGLKANSRYLARSEETELAELRQ